jgi:hypothetical protein
MEGSGAGSVLVTNRSVYGSGRLKTIRIPQIRIHNTAFELGLGFPGEQIKISNADVTY